ncbi:CPBP family intramembrane glutamic endopeptidase [Agromyces salentinus]|uniref:CAAX prenyl protease 2/Lysostaphin resistance protein A-like domain-containing protein n=1 Tax=Agromyces salentinus TaxID=269421 RepID=A0ABP4Z9R0_9MICO|nr:CPBP family intramembrane glutamic endopeptidase [Agromyces salentinus]
MTDDRSLRIAPRVWLGVLAYLLYLAVFYGVWIINGIDYNKIGDSEDTLWKWYVAPLLAGTVVIVIVVSIYGWWRPSLFETKKRLPAWVWIFPGLLAVLALIGLFVGDTSGVTPTMWVLLVVGSVLVGFNEELVTRGQLIVALRSRFGELGVWFFSTLLFALLHLPNTLFGTGVFGLTQVGTTFLLGTVFYLLRRVSGTLIIAMLLHGLWDFSTFAAPSGLTGIAGVIVGGVAVIVAIILIRKETRNTDKVTA